MVQDTSCSPETFDNAFRWGMELGSSDIERQSLRSSLAQRDVVWAVNVPGEAEWCYSSRTDVTQRASREGEFASYVASSDYEP